MQYSPICATNGKSYSSPCYMEQEACENKEINVKVAKHGACGMFHILTYGDLETCKV